MIKFPQEMNYSSALDAGLTTLSVALAGNPNAGKSTLFNALTGASQHVGNWPGKTVEKKTGVLTVDKYRVHLTDLPGAYSLNAYTAEEIIARAFLLEERPDAVISVIDAANLERNLYLAVQLLELEQPVIVVLNMMDMADNQGLSIDVDELSRALVSPIFPAVARKGKGLEDLAEATIVAVAEYSQTFKLDYGPEIEAGIAGLEETLNSHTIAGNNFPVRWLAIKLLEGDVDIAANVKAMWGGETLLATAESIRAEVRAVLDEDVDLAIADRRYSWIHQLSGRVIRSERDHLSTRSDRIDRVITHRWWGIPIFLGALWVVFKLTTDLSAPWVDWFDQVLTGPVSRWSLAALNALGMGQTWVASLVLDGIIAGVGGVLAFVPVLLALYFALAVLEDSGYMARGAFVMDRLMNRIGLHGRSFLPLMVGFGCSVPAIYATRTLSNRRDRILTGLLVPFMSCSARLPVYILFAAIFFPGSASLVILGLYLLGIVVAVGVGLTLQRTVLPATASSGLVMELPPYRLPHARSIWYHMWQRTRAFLEHAASLILLTTMFIWLLTAIPWGGRGSFAATPMEESAFGRVSAAFSPALQPLGFGSWQAGGALLSGLVAKEVVVSTLAQTYSNGVEEAIPNRTSFSADLAEIVTSFGHAVIETIQSLPGLIGVNLLNEEESTDASLASALRADFSNSSGGYPAAAGLAFMVFVLLYTPCMAAIAAERQEFGTKWALLSLLGQLIIAWLVAFIVFNAGAWLGGE